MVCGLCGLASTVLPYCITQEALLIVRPTNMSEWRSCRGKEYGEKLRCCRCAANSRAAAGQICDPWGGLKRCSNEALTWHLSDTPDLFSVLQSWVHNLRLLKCSRNLIHNHRYTRYRYTIELKLHGQGGLQISLVEYSSSSSQYLDSLNTCNIYTKQIKLFWMCSVGVGPISILSSRSSRRLSSPLDGAKFSLSAEVR